jgi:hypothetical protein
MVEARAEGLGEAIRSGSMSPQPSVTFWDRLTQSMMSPMAPESKRDEALLRAHMLHVGLYGRVAIKLGVHPSLVSRVARGERNQPEVRRALLEELRRIQDTLK